MFAICGSLSVLSLFAICHYLYRHQLFTIWQLRTTLEWPSLIAKYRDHTRTNLGHVGIWYYVVIVSLALSLVSIIGLLVIEVLTAV